LKKANKKLGENARKEQEEKKEARKEPETLDVSLRRADNQLMADDQRE